MDDKLIMEGSIICDANLLIHFMFTQLEVFSSSMLLIIKLYILFMLHFVLVVMKEDVINQNIISLLGPSLKTIYRLTITLN